MLVMDGVEAVMTKKNVTTNGTTKVVTVPAGNKPVVHVFRQSKTPFINPLDPECCKDRESPCCKLYGDWSGLRPNSSANGSLPVLLNGKGLANLADTPQNSSGAQSIGKDGKHSGSSLLNAAHGKPHRQLLYGKEEFRCVRQCF